MEKIEFIIAESSEKSLELWKNLFLQTAKVGVISTKQEKQEKQESFSNVSDWPTPVHIREKECFFAAVTTSF